MSRLEVYLRHANITVKAEVMDTKDMFKTLGPIQELFDSCVCGHCKGKDIRFSTRQADGHDVYELVCCDPKCKAKLALGTRQDTQSLFPRRYEQHKNPDTNKWEPKKDGDGKIVYLPHNGWVKWKNRSSD